MRPFTILTLFYFATCSLGIGFSRNDFQFGHNYIGPQSWPKAGATNTEAIGPFQIIEYPGKTETSTISLGCLLWNPEISFDRATKQIFVMRDNTVLEHFDNSRSRDCAAGLGYAAGNYFAGPGGFYARADCGFFEQLTQPSFREKLRINLMSYTQICSPARLRRANVLIQRLPADGKNKRPPFVVFLNGIQLSFPFSSAQIASIYGPPERNDTRTDSAPAESAYWDSYGFQLYTDADFSYIAFTLQPAAEYRPSEPRCEFTGQMLLEDRPISGAVLQDSFGKADRNDLNIYATPDGHLTRISISSLR